MNLSKAQKFLDSSDAYIRDIFTCITKHAKPKDICGDSDNDSSSCLSSLLGLFWSFGFLCVCFYTNLKLFVLVL